MRAKYGLDVSDDDAMMSDDADEDGDGDEDVSIPLDHEEWYSSEDEFGNGVAVSVRRPSSKGASAAHPVNANELGSASEGDAASEEEEEEEEDASMTSSDDAYQPDSEADAAAARRRAGRRRVSRRSRRPPTAPAAAATAAAASRRVSAASSAPGTAAAAAIAPQLSSRGRNVRREWRLDPRQVDVFSDDFEALPLEIQVGLRGRPPRRLEWMLKWRGIILNSQIILNSPFTPDAAAALSTVRNCH